MGKTQRPRSSIFITPHLGPPRAATARRPQGRRPPTDRDGLEPPGPQGVFDSIACFGRPPAPGYPPQQRQKFGAHAGKIQRGAAGVPFRHSHQIRMDRQKVGVQTEKFPQQTLDAIADHRIAYFAGNSHARARTIAGMLSRKHKQEEMLGMVTSAPLIAGGKFPPAANSDVPWKGQTRHKSPRHTTRAAMTARLGTQIFTALGATAAQNGATAGGSHAGTETVGTGSSDFTGLVCSFHKAAPFSFLRDPPATTPRQVAGLRNYRPGNRGGGGCCGVYPPFAPAACPRGGIKRSDP